MALELGAQQDDPQSKAESADKVNAAEKQSEEALRKAGLLYDLPGKETAKDKLSSYAQATNGVSEDSKAKVDSTFGKVAIVADKSASPPDQSPAAGDSLAAQAKPAEQGALTSTAKGVTGMVSDATNAVMGASAAVGDAVAGGLGAAMSLIGLDALAGYLGFGGGDASKTILNPSKVEKDPSGRVSKVTDSAGKVVEFQYDGQSKVAGFKDGSGQWKSADGKTWTNDKGEQWNGQVTVNDKGEFVRTDQSGRRTTSRPDGTNLVENTDGSKVEHDKNGKTTRLVDADQNVYEFKYDASGKLISAKDGSGTWASKDGKNWTNEKGDSWKGTPSVDADGSYSYLDASGTRRTLKADATKTVENTDGSKIDFDRKGDVTGVSDPTGRKYEFGYSDDGKLVSTKNSFGTWKTTDGREWTNENGDKWRGAVTVDAQGDYSYVDESGTRTTLKPSGAKVTENPGGNKVTENLDGSRVEANPAGHVTKVSDYRGTSFAFEYGKDDKLVAVKDAAGAWKSSDGKTWVNEKGERWQGQIAVDENGCCIYKGDTGPLKTIRPDGSKIIENSDGSKVQSDRNGDVTQVFDAKGHLYKFQYDQQRKLTGVENADGKWTSTDGQNWTNDSGCTWKGQVSVDANGKYAYVDSDGKRSTLNTDGTTLIENKDGSKVYSNGDGHVTSVSNIYGKVSQFQYDAAGKLIGIKSEQGSWQSSDGQSWTSPKGEKWQATIAVDPSGEWTAVEATGKTTTAKLDGTTVTDRPDGSEVVANKDGKITSVYDAKGKSFEFEYGPTGKLAGVTNDFGHWKTSDGKTWTNEKGAQWQGDVKVDKDGNYLYLDTFGQSKTQKPDGSSLVQNADGSTMQVGKAGQITNVVDAAGRARQFEYDAKGQLSAVHDADTSWKTQDGKSWVSEKGEPFKGQIGLDANGNLSFKSDSGKLKAENLDGTILNKNADGTAVETNAQGKVTRVVEVSGKTTRFEYGANGQLTAINDGSSNWTSQDGKNFVNEKGVQWRGQVSATGDGTVAWQYESGKRETVKIDGSVVTEIPGKGRTELGPDGKLVSVRSEVSPGQFRDLKYGASGLTEIRNPDGTTFQKGADDTWTIKSPTSPNGVAWKGTVETDLQGNVFFKQAGSNDVMVARADGTVARQQGVEQAAAAKPTAPGGQLERAADAPPAPGKTAGPAGTNIDRSEPGPGALPVSSVKAGSVVSDAPAASSQPGHPGAGSAGGAPADHQLAANGSEANAAKPPAAKAPEAINTGSTAFGIGNSSGVTLASAPVKSGDVLGGANPAPGTALAVKAPEVPASGQFGPKAPDQSSASLDLRPGAPAPAKALEVPATSSPPVKLADGQGVTAVAAPARTTEVPPSAPAPAKPADVASLGSAPAAHVDVAAPAKPTELAPAGAAAARAPEGAPVVPAPVRSAEAPAAPAASAATVAVAPAPVGAGPASVNAAPAVPGPTPFERQPLSPEAARPAAPLSPAAPAVEGPRPALPPVIGGEGPRPAAAASTEAARPVPVLGAEGPRPTPLPGAEGVRSPAAPAAEQVKPATGIPVQAEAPKAPALLVAEAPRSAPGPALPVDGSRPVPAPGPAVPASTPGLGEAPRSEGPKPVPVAEAPKPVGPTPELARSAPAPDSQRAAPPPDATPRTVQQSPGQPTQQPVVAISQPGQPQPAPQQVTPAQQLPQVTPTALAKDFASTPGSPVVVVQLQPGAIPSAGAPAANAPPVVVSQEKQSSPSSAQSTAVLPGQQLQAAVGSSAAGAQVQSGTSGQGQVPTTQQGFSGAAGSVQQQTSASQGPLTGQTLALQAAPIQGQQGSLVPGQQGPAAQAAGGAGQGQPAGASQGQQVVVTQGFQGGTPSGQQAMPQAQTAFAQGQPVTPGLSQQAGPTPGQQAAVLPGQPGGAAGGLQQPGAAASTFSQSQPTAGQTLSAMQQPGTAQTGQTGQTLAQQSAQGQALPANPIQSQQTGSSQAQSAAQQSLQAGTAVSVQQPASTPGQPGASLGAQTALPIAVPTSSSEPRQTPQGQVPGGTQGQVPGGTQGQVPGGTQGQVPGGTQGQVPGGTQGQVPGGTQGQVPGGTQGQVPGGTQGQVPGGTQGQVPGGTQGQVPGGTQGQVPGATQGQVPGGTQGQVPGATQGQVPGGTQGQVPGGTQGQAQTTAAGQGQVGISTQGSTAGSVPGQTQATASGVQGGTPQGQNIASGPAQPVIGSTSSALTASSGQSGAADPTQTVGMTWIDPSGTVPAQPVNLPLGPQNGTEPDQGASAAQTQAGSIEPLQGMVSQVAPGQKQQNDDKEQTAAGSADSSSSGSTQQGGTAPPAPAVALPAQPADTIGGDQFTASPAQQPHAASSDSTLVPLPHALPADPYGVIADPPTAATVAGAPDTVSGAPLESAASDQIAALPVSTTGAMSVDSATLTPAEPIDVSAPDILATTPASPAPAGMLAEPQPLAEVQTPAPVTPPAGAASGEFITQQWQLPELELVSSPPQASVSDQFIPAVGNNAEGVPGAAPFAEAEPVITVAGQIQAQPGIVLELPSDSGNSEALRAGSAAETRAQPLSGGVPEGPALAHEDEAPAEQSAASPTGYDHPSTVQQPEEDPNASAVAALTDTPAQGASPDAKTAGAAGHSETGQPEVAAYQPAERVETTEKSSEEQEEERIARVNRERDEKDWRDRQEQERRDQEEQARRDLEDQERRAADIALSMLGTKKVGEEQGQDRDPRVNADSLAARREQRRRYVVRRNDTLESIAAKMLQDSKLAALIYQINKAVIPIRAERGKMLLQLKPKLVIYLPTGEEIRVYRAKPISSRESRFEYVAAAGTSHVAPENQPDENNEDRSERTGKRSRPHHAETKAGQRLENCQDEAAAASDAQRRSVESLLGVLSVSAEPGERIKYRVRLGDTLQTIALRHPALQDALLWTLLAEVNQLPATTDDSGIPVATVKRGSTLIIPTAREVAEFREREKLERAIPRRQWRRGATTTSFDLAARSCPECGRITTLSATICSACGHSFEAPAGQSEAESDAGAPAAVEVAPEAARSLSGSSKLQDRMEMPPQVESPASHGTPNDRPEIQLPAAVVTGAENLIRRLGAASRLVGSFGVVWETGLGFLSRLEVRKHGEWATVVAYETRTDGSWRHEFTLDGQRKSLKLDLPPAAVQELAENDLASNWQSYCERFRAGRSISE